jgi:PAS domain S-box-containing protein
MGAIVTVRLENEMDLILAHKRAMRLSELCGLSLITQTSIATAISEIARCAIEHGKNAELRLDIDLTPQKRFLKAVIRDSIDFTPRCKDALHYAERLVSDINVVSTPKETLITLLHKLNPTMPLTEATLKSFADYFKLEPPLSPYDELRRKNRLLQEFAEKLQEKEKNFRLLTDSLPLMMFSANNRGQVTYSNKWVLDFLGATPKEITSASWKGFIHPDEFVSFSRNLGDGLAKQISVTGQYRLKEQSSGDYLWHIISLFPLKNEKGEITLWIGFIVDINSDRLIGQTLKDNAALKEVQEKLFENQAELQQKIVELNRSNYELEKFAHLASHDLQEPLRKMFFYSDSLLRKYSSKLDESGLKAIESMRAAAGRMKDLIRDLLSYSQLQQQKMLFEEVDLDLMFEGIIDEMDLSIQEKRAVIQKENLPVIHGNTIRLRQLFVNLVGNALKYSKTDTPPVINITSHLRDKTITIKVRDNGIGFDETYKEKIFGLFERLHTKDQFPGTGIGLSICKRIAELHYGEISATSEQGSFAEFEVVLPVEQILLNE